MKEDKETTGFVEKTCPLCEGEVHGNDKALYYCKHCNILFSKESLKSRIIKENPQPNQQRT